MPVVENSFFKWNELASDLILPGFSEEQALCYWAGNAASLAALHSASSAVDLSLLGQRATLVA